MTVAGRPTARELEEGLLVAEIMKRPATEGPVTP